MFLLGLHVPRGAQIMNYRHQKFLRQEMPSCLSMLDDVVEWKLEWRSLTNIVWYVRGSRVFRWVSFCSTVSRWACIDRATTTSVTLFAVGYWKASTISSSPFSPLKCAPRLWQWGSLARKPTWRRLGTVWTCSSSSLGQSTSPYIVYIILFGYSGEKIRIKCLSPLVGAGRRLGETAWWGLAPYNGDYLWHQTSPQSTNRVRISIEFAGMNSK